MANEAFSTLLTLIGGFDGVDFLVLHQVFFVAEGLLAFSTAKELLCGMTGLMSNQV